MENQRDEKLWRLAEKRVKFKRHVASYVVVNIFFWALWFFTRNQYTEKLFPWPAWVSLGWGFGLFMNYIRVYHGHSDNDVEQEYRKLVDNEK